MDNSALISLKRDRGSHDWQPTSIFLLLVASDDQRDDSTRGDCQVCAFGFEHYFVDAFSKPRRYGVFRATTAATSAGLLATRISRRTIRPKELLHQPTHLLQRVIGLPDILRAMITHVHALDALRQLGDLLSRPITQRTSERRVSKI